jgi:hypothetical protein
LRSEQLKTPRCVSEPQADVEWTRIRK